MLYFRSVALRLSSSHHVLPVPASTTFRLHWRYFSATTSNSNDGLSALLKAEGPRRFTFVGGKGGVGKTTTAAALSIALARTGRKTLVVSTDPAHSLGDALAKDLTGDPVEINLTGLNLGSGTGSLHAMEIDPSVALQDLQENLNVQKLKAMLESQEAGIGAGLLTFASKAGFDLDNLAKLLETTPPGVDEAVALAKLMQLLHSDNEFGNFERVVIDTAPTGHTLRFLSFPQFLHQLIHTILTLHETLSSGFSPFAKVLGNVFGDDIGNQLRITRSKLEQMMSSMSNLSTVFTDRTSTDFVVVTIPTHLAVSESKRLVAALEKANMPVQFAIANQCPALTLPGARDSEAFANVLTTVGKIESRHEEIGISFAEVAALRVAMERSTRQFREAEAQLAILEESIGSSVHLTKVPIFDLQLTGVQALDLYAEVLFKQGGI